MMTLYDRQAELEKTISYVEGEISAVQKFIDLHEKGPFVDIWVTELKLDLDIYYKMTEELQEVKALIADQERYENDTPDIC